jgi:hypothetical protein
VIDAEKVIDADKVVENTTKTVGSKVEWKSFKKYDSSFAKQFLETKWSIIFYLHIIYPFF